VDRIADAELVARASSGDRSAFGALIERHQPMVRRIAGGVVGHDDTARELATRPCSRRTSRWTGFGTPRASRASYTASS